MNPLPLIPTPLAQRWREFRFRIVPILVFLGALLVLTMMWRQYVAPPTMVGQVESMTAYVSSPKAGPLAQLNLACLQRVQAGEPLPQKMKSAPKGLTLSFDHVHAEIHPL